MSASKDLMAYLDQVDIKVKTGQNIAGTLNGAILSPDFISSSPKLIPAVRAVSLVCQALEPKHMLRSKITGSEQQHFWRFKSRHFFVLAAKDLMADLDPTKHQGNRLGGKFVEL